MFRQGDDVDGQVPGLPFGIDGQAHEEVEQVGACKGHVGAAVEHRGEEDDMSKDENDRGVHILFEEFPAHWRPLS